MEAMDIMGERTIDSVDPSALNEGFKALRLLENSLSGDLNRNVKGENID